MIHEQGDVESFEFCELSQKSSMWALLAIHTQDTFSADAQHNFLKLRKILKSATRLDDLHQKDMTVPQVPCSLWIKRLFVDDVSGTHKNKSNITELEKLSRKLVCRVLLPLTTGC